MFGHTSQNSDNQSENAQTFGDNPVGPAPTAPSLPTMGGQASPFSPAPTQPQAAPLTDPVVQPDPQVVPQSEEEHFPHNEDTSHMMTDHGSPDPIDSNQDFDSDSMNDSVSSPTLPSGDLVDIKQSALQQLSPLVSHLDQSAEEKFRTTMMMIQATDDQSLLKQAYESAQKIEDDKARAQALLDVINEINYFTQQGK